MAGIWAQQPGQLRIVRYFEDGIVHNVKGLAANAGSARQRYGRFGFPEGTVAYIPDGVDRNRSSGRLKQIGGGQYCEQVRQQPQHSGFAAGTIFADRVLPEEVP